MKVFELLEHRQPHAMGWPSETRSHGLFASRQKAQSEIRRIRESGTIEAPEIVERKVK